MSGFQTCSFPFSSRRRHTRCLSDWSSDVCSSDLKQKTAYEMPNDWSSDVCSSDLFEDASCTYEPVQETSGGNGGPGMCSRSEERRVGEESRSRWVPYHLKKTQD